MHFGYTSRDDTAYNTDRHLTNFGVLRDSRSGDVLGAAPIFDNGRSLFFNTSFDQVDSLAMEAQFCLPSWPQVAFDEQAARLIGPVQKAQLECLAAFEFADSEAFPFPERYLAALAAFIRRRAEELCALPDVSREALLRAARGAQAWAGSGNRRPRSAPRCLQLPFIR